MLRIISVKQLLVELQCCILSPFLFNLYTERIMRKAEMEEAKGVKIAGRTLRYADDTTFMAGKNADMTKLMRRLIREKSKRRAHIST